MKIKVGQAIGLNTDQQAALVLSSPTDEETFLAVLKLTCDDAFTKGRQVLSEVEDLYHEGEGTTAQKLQDIFASAQEKLKDTQKYSLLLAVVTGKVLYFVREGEIEVYLKRGGKLSSLSELAKPNQLVSGFLLEGDRVFFATNSLTSFLGDDLEKSLDLSIDAWEEETNSRIAEAQDQGLSGLVVDVIGEDPSISPASVQEEQTTQRNPKGAFGSLMSKIKGANGSAVEEEQLYQDSPKKRINLNFGKFIPKTKRGRLIVGVILIAILAVGIGMQYKKATDQQKDIEFNQYLQTAKDDYVAAQNLSALNSTDTKTKLQEAKENIIKALTLKPSNSDALDLKKQMEENSDKLLQQFAAANFPEFLDLNLVKNGFRANWMSLSGTNLLLLDPSSKTLVSIDVAKKSNKVLAGQDQLGSALLTSLNGNFAFVYSTDKGIIRIDTTNNKATTVAKADERSSSTNKDLKDVVDIAGFASNVYLLDKGNNKIWKYLATTDGFSDKKEYLNSGAKADFAGVIRMQIESSIYVLKANGTILRYTKGATDSFALTGLDKPLKDPKSFFTSSDVENIYILDSGNGRLVVVDKKGSYKAQYQGDKFSIASDIVVDAKNKKLYILDGSKIYSMDLK